MNYSPDVDAALTNDFPFVADLPKAEKKKVASLWDRYKEFAALVDKHGPPVQFSLAAKLLGVSTARVSELVADGRFELIESPDGKRVITGNSFVQFCKLERKNGRPTKVESSPSAIRLTAQVLSTK